ncbi:SOS response-associated peptidase family protein [Mesobacillus zeae]|uniref:SOS response-associated peptidase family protein n=1 Tax=Mesobacillus zeae TaxID=1917180 RepID=UPI001FE3F01F|nr:SOS response-associated peptidase family protein [Mesobacillus zeae]
MQDLKQLLKKAVQNMAFKQRRCLIPADGFYEWKKDGEKKPPYRFVLNSRKPFEFAG